MKKEATKVAAKAQQTKVQTWQDVVRKDFANAKASAMNLTTVCNTVKKHLSDGEVKKLVDANWKTFIDTVKNALPHYVLNGKVIPCDWVDYKEKSENAKMCVSAYRYGKEDEIVQVISSGEKVSQPAIIKREVEVTKTIIVKDDKGNDRVISELDAEGKTVKEIVTKTLMPREKTSWGYTPIVLDAIIATIENLQK